MVKKISLSVVVAAALIAGLVTVWHYYDYLYWSVAYAKIAANETEGIRDADQQQIVDRLFGFLREAMDIEMTAGAGLNSFSYLEHGYAFCDSQDDVLANLLYFRGINARLVPLFKENGDSPHTIMQWYNGSQWLVMDPYMGFNLAVSGKELVGILELPEEAVAREHPDVLEAYRRYTADPSVKEALLTTLKKDDRVYWGLPGERKRPVSKLLDQVSKDMVAVSDVTIPNIIQKMYFFKHYRGDAVYDRYMRARNRRLFGDYEFAQAEYSRLLAEDLPQEWPPSGTFSLNALAVEDKIDNLERLIQRQQ